MKKLSLTPNPLPLTTTFVVWPSGNTDGTTDVMLGLVANSRAASMFGVSVSPTTTTAVLVTSFFASEYSSPASSAPVRVGANRTEYCPGGKGPREYEPSAAVSEASI